MTLSGDPAAHSIARGPVAADGDGWIEVRLTVNGQAEVLRARSHHTLLEALRRELNLTGPREGCGVGMCGACTVLMDGRPVSGCLVLAPMADGADIVTVEGLEAPDGTLHPVQQAFVDHTAFQCSYCTPGFLLTTKAMLDEGTPVTRESACAYLAGNLCRCGSYVKILDAVEDAAARRDGLAGG